MTAARRLVGASGSRAAPIGTSGSRNGTLRWTGPAGPAAAVATARPTTDRHGPSSPASPSSSGSSANHFACAPVDAGPGRSSGARRGRAARAGDPRSGRSAARARATPRPRPAASSTTAVPDVTRMATGRRDARAMPEREEARRRARRAGPGRGVPGARAQRSASGVEREPGQTTASRHAAATSSSTNARRSASDVGHRRRPPATPPSAAVIVRSLSRDSSHSRAGSESATIPQPAKSVARGRSTSPQRRATISSPSPSAPSQPIGPAYQPRSKPSCSSMSAERDVARRAADRRRRVEPAGEREQPGLSRQRARDRRDEVLDVAQRQDAGRLGDVQRLGDRRQAVAERVDDDGVLLAVLLAREQRGGERGVLGGVGAARGSTPRSPRSERPARPSATRRSGVAPRNVRPLAAEREGRALRRARRQATEGVRRRRGRPATSGRPVAPARPCRSGRARPRPANSPTVRSQRVRPGAPSTIGERRAHRLGRRCRRRPVQLAGAGAEAVASRRRGGGSASSAVRVVTTVRRAVRRSGRANVGQDQRAAPNGAQASSASGAGRGSRARPGAPGRAARRRVVAPSSASREEVAPGALGVANRSGPSASTAHARPIPTSATLGRPEPQRGLQAARRPPRTARSGRARSTGRRRGERAGATSARRRGAPRAGPRAGAGRASTRPGAVTSSGNASSPGERHPRSAPRTPTLRSRIARSAG